MPLLMI